MLANLAGTGILVFAHFRVALGCNDLNLHPFLRLTGMLLMITFGIALVFSLYLEIPLINSYLRPKRNPLARTGTYALCRHPGVLWYFFFGIGLALASSHRWAILAVAVWALMNLFLAWIQDRFYFPQMFPDYKMYKTATPFLIPTNASIKRFWESLRK